MAKFSPPRPSYLCCALLLICFVLMLGFLTMVIKTRKIRSGDYVAAVVEYSPVAGVSPQDTISQNTAQYEKIIANSSAYEVDIIVFPEAGLTGLAIPSDRKLAREYLIEIPSPDDLIVPSLDDKCHQILQRLSHAARTNRVYVAVNLLEILHCAKGDASCPEDGAFFYNTNIVFDRDGMLVAKYRKYNLFVEKAFNSTKEAELCTFDTDFGVTFGMFICFDIMFTEPSVKLVKEKHVTDIVYSTAWFSELPLLTAVSTQAAWAHSMDVNLLAAGYDCPQMMGGGSGIYAGARGPLVVLMPENATTKILIARVPKKSSNADSFLDGEEGDRSLRRNSLILPPTSSQPSASCNGRKFLQDISLRSFTVKPLRGVKSDKVFRDELSYENGGFACSVNVAWMVEGVTANLPGDAYYKLVAYSGNRNFSTASVNYIEVCGLVLCADSDLNSCGILPDVDKRMTPKVTIASIVIKVKSYNISSIPVPSTLDSSIYPLHVSDFTFESAVSQDENGKSYCTAEMKLIKPVSNLLTFAIYKLPSDPSTKQEL